MSTWLILVCLGFFLALFGSGILGALYGRGADKFHLADRLIVGLTAVVGMAEIAHLAAVFLARSFSDTVCLFAAETIAGVMGALGICLWLRAESRSKNSSKPGSRSKDRRRKGEHSKWSGGDFTPCFAAFFLIFVLLVIYQIVTVSAGDNVWRSGDMTVETVESFLETNGVYRVDPLTGQAYKLGVPLRIRILCLPTLYGILCRLFGMRAVKLVWELVPLLVLLLSYLAFWTLAKALFAEEKDREKRLLFMVFVAALLCVGDYLYGMDGFGLMHCGYRGVTIRNMILMPYTFGLALRHKWKPVLLCILAEACLVWTLYGMGTCLVAALGMGALRIWQKQRRKAFCDAGEEA